MKSTQNERKVLKYLIENGRATDIEISQKLKISSQAVGKIRKKLENEKIIKGYSVNIDMEKLGVTVYAIAIIKPSPLLWNEFGEQQFYERIQQNPYIFSMFQTPSGELIFIGGFRDQKELELFMHEVTKKYGDYFPSIDVKTFSAFGLKKMDCKGIFKYLLDNFGKPRRLYPLNDQNEGVLLDI